MDIQLFKYIEGKDNSFRVMLNLLKQLQFLKKNNLIELKSEEINDKLIDSTIQTAEKFTD